MAGIKQRFETKGIKLVSKTDSRLMKFVNFFATLIGIRDFMTGVWTTFGSTIYYPTTIKNPYHYVYKSTLLHEEVHIDDQRKYPVLMQLSYALGLPLPIGLAYFRAYWEVRGYAMNIIYGGRTFDECVDSICSSLYLWPWPRKQVKKMLIREVERLQQ